MKKEYAARNKFRGTLDLTEQLKLHIQIMTRAKEETFPTLKKQSNVADASSNVNDGKVDMQRVCAEVEDPDQTPVEQDSQVKAFNYGKQLVPVPKHQEEKLKGEETTQEMKMLGFAMVDSIPRHHFLGSVDVVIGVNSVKNQRAFTAIVRAMIELKRVLIARIVERKNA